MNWRLRVWDADGVSNERAYEVPGAPEARITRLEWDVARGGRCLSCSWDGLPSALDVGPRDVVQVQTRAGPGDAWVNRWLGYVTSAPSANIDDVGAYQAVGLYQRLYEINARFMTDGGDVGFAAQNVAPVTGGAYVLRPGGMLSFGAGVDIPLTGSQMGIATMTLVSAGDVYDHLAELVGQFVVPPGETYEYDGHTFVAGDLVPAVVWGINADGVLFFRRPTTSEAIVNENDADVAVRWLNETGEEFYNVVRLAFPFGWDQKLLKRAVFVEASGSWPSGGTISGSTEVLEPRPMAFSYGPGLQGPVGARSERLVVLENPLDLMLQGEVTVTANADWDDLANVTDGDITTFAAPVAASVPSARGYATAIDETVPTALVLTVTQPDLFEDGFLYTPHGLWALRYATDEPAPIIESFQDGATVVTDEVGDAEVSTAGIAFTVAMETMFELPSANTDQNIVVSQVFLPSVSPANGLDYAFGANWARGRKMTLVGVTGTRLYDARYYAPDQEACSLYARAFLKEINRAASEIAIAGHEPLATDVIIHKRAGGTEEARVERTEYRLSTEEGAITILRVGSAYDSEEEAARIVLERVIGRVARREQTP